MLVEPILNNLLAHLLRSPAHNSPRTAAAGAAAAGRQGYAGGNLVNLVVVLGGFEVPPGLFCKG